MQVTTYIASRTYIPTVHQIQEQVSAAHTVHIPQANLIYIMAQLGMLKYGFQFRLTTYLRQNDALKWSPNPR